MAFSSVLVRAIQTTTRSLSVAPLRYQLRHVATKPSLLDTMEPKSFARRDKLREIEADVQVRVDFWNPDAIELQYRQSMAARSFSSYVKHACLDI